MNARDREPNEQYRQAMMHGIKHLLYPITKGVEEISPYGFRFNHETVMQIYDLAKMMLDALEEGGINVDPKKRKAVTAKRYAAARSDAKFQATLRALTRRPRGRARKLLIDK